MRWLVPIRGLADGNVPFGIYEPWRWRARMFKFVMARALRHGWRGRTRNRLGIPQRQLEPLRRMVKDSTGREASLFSMAVGADNRVAKVTIQALDGEGRTLGFFKMGLTPAAERRVRHEAEMLNRLAAAPALSGRIPAALATGTWNGRYVLLQSPVGEQRGPERFLREHERFLETLQQVAPSARRADELVEEVEARWARAAFLAPASWRITVSAALDRAWRLLDHEPVACGPAHGDFAPWNTRWASGRIAAFDWELAEWNAPAGWDRLHFLVQWDCLVHPHWRPERVLGEVCEDDRSTALALLYLVRSASRLAEEGIPWGDPSMRYRKQALELLIGGGTPGTVRPVSRRLWSGWGWRR
ncbi:MAG TPA: hypothetical protein ENJ62_06180 [Bryobacterales bacterium]|nr:hypothetical protein [Bryobacterales bacterium]